MKNGVSQDKKRQDTESAISEQIRLNLPLYGSDFAFVLYKFWAAGYNRDEIKENICLLLSVSLAPVERKKEGKIKCQRLKLIMEI